ncbi:hypothetical protein D3C87_1842490 [compost metagenome]
MNDVVSAFVGGFLRAIDFQPGIARCNLCNAANVIVVMVGQQDRIRRQVQAIQRCQHRLCLAGIDDSAMPLLVIQ